MQVEASKRNVRYIIGVYWKNDFELVILAYPCNYLRHINK